MSDPPQTLDDAVNLLLATLSASDKLEVRSTPESDLIAYHHGWGTGIRNGLGLWGDNQSLLRSCEDAARTHNSYGEPATVLSGSSIDPDTASGIIIDAVWHALQSMEMVYGNEKFDETCRIIAPDFKSIDAELVAYFSRHPDRLYDLEPRKFEELLEAVFRNQDYRAVLGPGWADGRIDLRLYLKDSVVELCTLVQAMKHDPKPAIRLEAVAALDALVSTENASRGLLVTTAQYLPSAVKFAKKRGHRLSFPSEDVARWCAEASKRMLR